MFIFFKSKSTSSLVITSIGIVFTFPSPKEYSKILNPIFENILSLILIPKIIRTTMIARRNDRVNETVQINIRELLAQEI